MNKNRKNIKEISINVDNWHGELLKGFRSNEHDD